MAIPYLLLSGEMIVSLKKQPKTKLFRLATGFTSLGFPPPANKYSFAATLKLGRIIFWNFWHEVDDQGKMKFVKFCTASPSKTVECVVWASPPGLGGTGFLLQVVYDMFAYDQLSSFRGAGPKPNHTYTWPRLTWQIFFQTMLFYGS